MLQFRINRILNDPTKEIKNNRNPYVLIMMTCIGIETLGEIFHPTGSSGEKSKPFREIANQLDKCFPRKLTKSFKTKLSKMWILNTETDKITTLSHLIYRYLRNDMTHTFIAKGVYLSYEDTNDFEVIENENEAFLIINPNWYFDRYFELFNLYFKEKIKSENELKKKLLRYYDRMLN